MGALFRTAFSHTGPNPTLQKDEKLSFVLSWVLLLAPAATIRRRRRDQKGGGLDADGLWDGLCSLLSSVGGVVAIISCYVVVVVFLSPPKRNPTNKPKPKPTLPKELGERYFISSFSVVGMR
ncbi:hypothetical protein Fcan01_21037 [Folsomia candida]|uniref:Uncharacterized protein n=1 Tax=Folsomia candida TaxID=158441 RepID=A0A226DHM4_FOLCA|nr:hypothetical protein Fcan01_21037 [Folsomia candida]